MKKKIKINIGDSVQEREINYIPVRYIIAFLITLLEVLGIIGVVVALCYYIPYFYIALYVTTFAVELKIIASNDNPDYKVPWMLFVLVLPIVGLMLYFIFSSRKLKKKYIRRLKELKRLSYRKDSTNVIKALNEESEIACSQAKMLCKIADTHVFANTKQNYFSSGEEYYANLLKDLEIAKKFIYMEYFIIEEGKFWNSILDILKVKAKNGVEVKVVFDDIGCMATLPGNYAKILRKFGIEATPFSRLKGSADSEFNNRNHRKIAVIDGVIGYTGGINIADEYINEFEKYGHWKDVGIRLEGEAVWELTRLFLIDYGINVKNMVELKNTIYPTMQGVKERGYLVPFGDGPKPLYERRVGKTVIQNMLAGATKYMYITTPYLIIDNELCVSIENTALRGVDVRIIVPHIPDKKIVFNMTRSYYKRLMDAGVKIYEYEPGFIHAKTYIADDKYAMIGTINLDYRSLVHHFENGVWMYNCDSIQDLKRDIDNTLSKSIAITDNMLKTNIFNKLFRAFVRIFAPML
ncbi:MAG: cardiolipin synthase [Clostridiales bacterium]|nr:cardiolipin synthase [Clostridiales bacterium]